MCWKVEYILLIIISTLIDYFSTQQMDKIEENEECRKCKKCEKIYYKSMMYSDKKCLICKNKI